MTNTLITHLKNKSRRKQKEDDVYTLAIDPSLRGCGWALFLNGRIVRAGLFRERGSINYSNLGEAVFHISREFTMEFTTLFLSEVIMEFPQVYRQALQKGDPNDLMSIAALAGAISNGLETFHREFVLPHDWKGNIPKDVMTNRIIRDTSPHETAIVLDAKCPESLRHNIWDAVGLGRWWLEKKALAPKPVLC